MHLNRHNIVPQETSQQASGSGVLDNKQDFTSYLLAENLSPENLIEDLHGVAILVTNPEYLVCYANPYSYDIFKLNAKSVKSGKAKLPSAIHKRLLLETQTLSNSKAKQGFTLQYARHNQMHTLQVFSSAHTDASGKVTAYVFHMHDISERVATELKLRRTEALLRSVINASPDLIYFKDEHNRWQEANSSGLSLLRLDAAQYINKTDKELSNLVHPSFKESLRRLQAADRYAWESGRTLREEETFSLPQGKKVYDIIKVPLFHEDGRREGLVTLARDITERKLAESLLTQRSAILDALISCDWLLHSAESWPKVAAQVLEQLTLAARFSRASLMQLGTKIEQSSAFLRQVHHWTNPKLHSFGEVANTIDFEADGVGRWLNILQNGNPIFGELESFSAKERKFLQDLGIQSLLIVPIFAGTQWWGTVILERHDVQQPISSHELGALMAVGRSLGAAILRESSGKKLHQAKIAFDSATEGIMIIDEDTNIIAINKGFTEITGYTEEEVLGQTPKAFYSSQHDMWNTLRQEGRWRGEVVNYRKNGDLYDEWMTLTAVKNEQGRIINYVGVFSDITEIKQSQSKLHELVYHDALTGLPNRRLLNELLEQSIKRAEREERQLAVLFIDLDRFKAINDTLGHPIGDKLLFEVSKRITRAVRESDVVARHGGDEFLVLMDIAGEQEDAALVAQKIIYTLQLEFVIDGKEIFIGASVGISIFPKDGRDVESLVKAADIAMYQVKNHGKNNHCFYSSELSTNVIERFTMENQLRRALERNQFELYYQPQISLITGNIVGAEALIRWNHPELGLVSPAKFIPMAEETGLIVQIGEWVLRQAALQASAWQAQLGRIMSISVNVSGIQVMRSNFSDTVYGILIETDCDPDSLELEITESTVMQNTDYVINTFNTIKQLGVRLAIDDFGTGYSSLSHLKRLPLDKLKIDKSFVNDLPDDLDDAAIANAINAMAKSLGFVVIAEGVESQEQADFLKAMGCEQAQGYLYSKAVSALDFESLFFKHYQ